MLPFSGWSDLVALRSDRSRLTYHPPNRFLRARKFDLAKTKEMLLSAEQWRKDFGVEDIMKSVFS